MVCSRLIFLDRVEHVDVDAICANILSTAKLGLYMAAVLCIEVSNLRLDLKPSDRYHQYIVTYCGGYKR